MKPVYDSPFDDLGFCNFEIPFCLLLDCMI